VLKVEGPGVKSSQTCILAYLNCNSLLLTFSMLFPKGGTQKGRLSKSTENVNVSKYMTESESTYGISEARFGILDDTNFRS
jgi:hypothetical protein